jgi:hypothetical protein
MLSREEQEDIVQFILLSDSDDDQDHLAPTPPSSPMLASVISLTEPPLLTLSELSLANDCSEQFFATLRNLHDSFKLSTGKEWLLKLEKIIESSLDILFDPSNHDKQIVIAAFNKLTKGDIEACSNADANLSSDMAMIKDLLILQMGSATYQYLFESQNSLKQAAPSIALIKFSAMQLLTKCCAKYDITLNFTTLAQKNILNNDYACFITGKNYNFQELIQLFHLLIKPFQLKTTHTDIFEHALLRFSGCLEFPKFSNFSDRKKVTMAGYRDNDEFIYSPGHFFVNLKLSNASRLKLVRELKRILGDKNCERTASQYEDCVALKLNLNAMVQLIFSQPYQSRLNDFLSCPIILRQYQSTCETQNMSFQQVFMSFLVTIKSYKLSPESNAIEFSLLKAFGVGEMLSAAKTQVAFRYDAFADYMDFYLGISVLAAKNLVIAINISFPNAATLVATNQRLPASGDEAMQVVAIQNATLLKQEFLARLKAALDSIMQNHPAIREQLEVQSKLKLHTTSDLVKKLNNLAQGFKESDLSLFSALTKLSVFASEAKPKRELEAAGFELTLAMAAHAGKLTNPAEYRLFKSSHKRVIKNIQEELGAKLPKL